jgi:mRNA interferase MazF
MNKATRGEVWNVNFDPTVGAEISKARPALVVNVPHVGKLPLVIVVPITDWKPAYADYAWFTHLSPTAENGLTKASGADAFQVKSISELRLVLRLGRAAEQELQAVAAAIALCVGYRNLSQLIVTTGTIRL